MRRKRDTQRTKIYRWEDDLPQGRSLTLEECKALVNEVYMRWGWQPPEVRDGRGTRHARGGRHEINLPRWARRERTVLHECAHGLKVCLAGDSYQEAPHGRTFARVVLQLYHEYLKIPLSELRASARKHRIKFARATACKAPPSRKLKELQALLAEYKAVCERSTELRERIYQLRSELGLIK